MIDSSQQTITMSFHAKSFLRSRFLLRSSVVFTVLALVLIAVPTVSAQDGPIATAPAPAKKRFKLPSFNLFGRKKIAEPQLDPFVTGTDAQAQLAEQLQQPPDKPKFSLPNDPYTTPKVELPKTKTTNPNLPSLPYPWPTPVDSAAPKRPARNLIKNAAANANRALHKTSDTVGSTVDGAANLANSTVQGANSSLNNAGQSLGNAAARLNRTSNQSLQHPLLTTSPVDTRSPARRENVSKITSNKAASPKKQAAPKYEFQPTTNASTTWSHLFPAAERRQLVKQGNRGGSLPDTVDDNVSTRRTISRPRPKQVAITPQFSGDNLPTQQLNTGSNPDQPTSAQDAIPPLQPQLTQSSDDFALPPLEPEQPAQSIDQDMIPALQVPNNESYATNQPQTMSLPEASATETTRHPQAVVLPQSRDTVALPAPNQDALPSIGQLPRQKSQSFVQQPIQTFLQQPTQPFHEHPVQQTPLQAQTQQFVEQPENRVRTPIATHQIQQPAVQLTAKDPTPPGLLSQTPVQVQPNPQPPAQQPVLQQPLVQQSPASVAQKVQQQFGQQNAPSADDKPTMVDNPWYSQAIPTVPTTEAVAQNKDDAAFELPATSSVNTSPSRSSPSQAVTAPLKVTTEQTATLTNEPTSPTPSNSTSSDFSLPESASSTDAVPNQQNPVADFADAPTITTPTLVEDSDFPVPTTVEPPTINSKRTDMIVQSPTKSNTTVNDGDRIDTGSTARNPDSDSWLNAPVDQTLAARNLPPKQMPGPYRPGSTGSSTTRQSFSPSMNRALGKLDEASQVIAIVGSQTILKGDVLGQINEMLKPYEGQASPEELDQQRALMVEQLLPRLVENKLVFQYFLSRGGPNETPVPPEQLAAIEHNVYELFRDKEMPRLLKRAKVKNAAELDATLRKIGSSLEKQRRLFMEKNVASEMVRRNIEVRGEVSHDEMLEHYYANLDEFTKPARSRWQQLTARFDKHASREEARRAIAMMGNAIHKQGLTFEEVAKKSSDGFAAAEGGHRDWTTKGSLVSTKLDEAIFALPLNGLSRIIEDDEGFHIVRVIERDNGGKVSFNEVQEDITKSIREGRFQGQVEKYIARLKRETPIWTLFDEKQNSEVQIASPPNANSPMR